MTATPPEKLEIQNGEMSIGGHIVQPLATFAPLVFGALIYVAFRPTSLLMFDWFHHIGAFPFVTELRIAAHPLRAFFPDWVVYSFPQAAWVWFGTLALLHIWRPSRSLASRAWVLVPCCLAVGGEVAQGLHVVPGTFDLTDVVFSILALVAALFFFRRFGEHQHA